MPYDDRRFYVYIMADRPRGILYIGMTNGILKRTVDHQNGSDPDSFTAKFNCSMLVYFEVYQYVDQAIHRETCLKRWKRGWKIRLIESVNPEWRDLYDDLVNGTYEETYSPLRDSKPKF